MAGLPEKHRFCSWCRALKHNTIVKSLGYQPPPSQARVLQRSDTPDGSNEDDASASQSQNGQQDYEEEIDEASDGDYDGDGDGESPDNEPHRLLDVKEGADDCFLCGKIWGAFQRWATVRYGSLDRVAVSRGRVEVRGTVAPRLSDERDGGLVPVGDDDWARGWLSKAMISVVVPDPEEEDEDEDAPFLISTDAFLQRCNAPDDRRDAPYRGRQRPLVADLGLFRRWKTLCADSHDSRCRPSLPSSLPAGAGAGAGAGTLRMLRVLDVQRLCLVEIADVSSTTAPTNWVALSYVWGTRPFVTLTAATLHSLQEEGSLADPVLGPTRAPASWLPPTIADAIHLTAGLGERYLWVDSLCIVQDSFADKARFLPQMAAIYQRATVTIVQAAGEDAFHGLPGVRPGTRFVAEEPFRIPDENEDDKNDDDDGDEDDWLMISHTWTSPDAGHGRWFTRGWTFQEDLLSPRLLIFTPEQVFWECRQAIWHEDANRELPSEHRELNDAVFYDSLFHDSTFHDSWVAAPPSPSPSPSSSLPTPSMRKFDRLYQRLVHSYTQRALGHPADGLNAFSGILQALTLVYGVDFVWGMPAAFLGMALTWPALSRDLPRRRDKCLVTVSDGDCDGASSDATRSVEVCFPSWAWAGWICHVYYYENFGNLAGEHAGLEFYHFPTTSSGNAAKGPSPKLALRHIPQNQHFLNYTSEHQTFAGTNPTWRGDTQVPITAGDVPASLREAEGKRYALLVFWTSRASLQLSCEGPSLSPGAGPEGSDEPDGPRYSLWVDDDTKLDASWDQLPRRGPADAAMGASWRKRTEAIVVGRSSLERLHGRGQLSVLLVDTDESGALSRYGNATVWEDDWNKLEKRRWEIVFLL